jgi:hypothetical protein
MLAGACNGFAQLSWDTRNVELRPGIDDASAVAKYPFKNTGPYPVAISNITASCPCTTATADKSDYAPGAIGVVTATYGIGAVSGTQTELIDVETNDKANSPVRLTMKVCLPQVLKLTPATVSWKVGEAPEPKTIEVEVVAARELNVTQALFIRRSRRSMGHFMASVQTVVPHRRYLVTVMPASTSEPAEEILTVVTDYPKFQVKREFATASIKADDAAGK